MCEGHQHRRRRARGFRGFPNREEMVERLRTYREHLEGELRNVDELLERLADAPQPSEGI